MSNDQRKQYKNATVLDQEYLDASQDNLLNKLELIVDIEKPGGGFIHASDRNKYIVDSTTGAGTFYEALLVFPVIKRTVGEFLSPALEFSNLELTLTNVDGRFNYLLPAGDNFDGWIGNSVTVKLGLGEIQSSYTTIFEGEITDQGGFKRSVSSITITARDKFDKINQSFPREVFKKTSFPNLEDEKENRIVPIIWGDWTVNVEPDMASIPTIVVNGADPNVNGDTSNTGNVQLVIANHPLISLDTTKVYLRRGEKVWLIPSTDIVNVSIATTPSSFEIKQNSGTMVAKTPDTDDQILVFGRGDEFFVRVRGKNLGTYSDNIIEQARDILITYGGVLSSEFDSNWDTLRDKSSPSESAISAVKSRVYIDESQQVLNHVLSLLEQVRIELFVDRNLKLKLLPLHLDEFVPNPAFKVRNWDIEKGSFTPRIDEVTNFNRAKGVFNFLPNRRENLQETSIYRNEAAITQVGKEISKKIVFPNLYESTTVVNQLVETLRITSSYLENIDLTLTWRSMLLDIGDFVKLNVEIQSSVFDSVPALIREIGYDPRGIKLPMRLWSFQMLPFPGHAPGNPGIVGGSTAVITEES